MDCCDEFLRHPMSGFSAEWLALRAAADRRARSPALVTALRRRLSATRRRDGPLRVVDLGAGTGSTLRLLSPLMPEPQHWTLVDNDGALLATVARRQGSRRIVVEAVHADLADRALLTRLLRGADLVTASALIDLVSEGWCRALASAAARRGTLLYAALSYDGRIVFEPSDPQDSVVHALFNRHQRRDKGFGPALGPAAAETLARLSAAAGAGLQTGRSDWSLAPGDLPLLGPLLDGWAAAAHEMAPERRDPIAAWHARRRALLASRRLRVRVGHRDILAWW